MLNLGFESTLDQRTVYVQDEPALEIALPELCPQPDLTIMQRGKVANVEALVSQVLRHHQEHPDGALGPVYQELVTEFQPLFAWTMACWDYLLSSEGCRFVPRQGEQRFGVRGDYRAVTDKDYSRVVHGLFRACVLEFARQPDASSLSHWLRQRLWPSILENYRKLETPPDPRQRILTPYSYLRCIPYQFLNEYHHDLVYSTVQRLPEMEQKAISTYFFHFYTEAASAAMLDWPVEELLGYLRAALVKLLVNDRLVYCLLRQIERY